MQKGESDKMLKSNVLSDSRPVAPKTAVRNKALISITTAMVARKLAMSVILRTK